MTGVELMTIAPHEPSLVRLMRALTTIGIMTEEGDGRFAITPMGELLRSDHPRSARAFAILMGEPMVWRALGAFEEAILTGEPAFDRVCSGFPPHAGYPRRRAIHPGGRTLPKLTRLAP